MHHIKERIKPFISWVVGDGKFIDPWCDRWIPDIGVATPKPNTTPDPMIRVSDCIDQNLRRWNLAKLSQHFDQSSVEKIVIIPLSSSISSDRRAWDLNRDGKFTTKSAYLALRGRSTQPQDLMWKKFWRIKIPYRVQLFVLKAAVNAIPVREILSQRIHLESVLCPFCQDQPESIMHIFLQCPCTRRVWNISNLYSYVNLFNGTDIRDWLRFWLGCHPYSSTEEKVQKFPLIACIMWSIWVGRNNLIHNARTDSHETILNRAMHLFPNKNPQRDSITQATPAGNRTLSWSPPPPGWTKFNTDGAWDHISNKGGAGLVVRNHAANFLYAAASHSCFISAEEAEIRGIWLAVKKAWEMNYKKVLIESDVEVVIDQINAGNFAGTWSTDALLQDIKNWKSNFENISFRFVPRCCNSVAHDLAHWGKTTMLDMFWASPPIWLMPALGRDAPS
ncbi:Reverse transcriptase zinc-binding domain [Macleaya cordata]|uniref:Reverse transcriptase zinc-binding domain n=1 Tax=Macleaya cordata TaxID=56857 RepID=A0A200QJ17_MACCD|nr:Reverse transcriptase zinc-binding domain [Macleaya cordata]